MNFAKITVLLFLITLIFQVQSKSLLDEFPTDISSLSAEEQSKILNKITIFSYQALTEVPVQGLSSKRLDIEEIISLRKWSETHQHPLFHLLALQLQRAIDMAIFNEVWRENQTSSKWIKSSYPF